MDQRPSSVSPRCSPRFGSTPNWGRCASIASSERTDAGRIINPKTARSQAIGGIIWGAGQALLEQSEMDPRTARFLSRNYSGYLVPTNADIPELDVLFVGDFDAEASPLGAKGLGELTAVSVAPAIANAVHHATGKRIRHLPITIEKLR